MLGVIWAPEWMQSGLSLWALWSLLSGANRPNSQEISYLLGSPKNGNLSCLRPGDAATWSVKTWGVLNALAKVIELQRRRWDELAPFDLCNFQDREYLLFPEPRYCPKCLTFGYHSPVFQHRAILECPIHGVRLLTGCSSCGNKLPSKFSSVAIQPFQCRFCNATLGSIPNVAIAKSFALMTHYVDATRQELKREGHDCERNSNCSTLLAGYEIGRLPDHCVSRVIRIAYKDIQGIPARRSIIRKQVILDDYDPDMGDITGIWSDALDVFLKVEKYFENKIGWVNADYLKIKRNIFFDSIDKSLADIANVSAIALYYFRNQYDQDGDDRWFSWNILVQRGLGIPQSALVPQFSDAVWESRKANKILFEYELYGNYVLSLIHALNKIKQPKYSWMDKPIHGSLLPSWCIKKNAHGGRILTIHTRVDGLLTDRILNRLQRERSDKLALRLRS